MGTAGRRGAALGAVLGAMLELPQRGVAGVMAFGAGALIAALGFLLAFALHQWQS